ncbi:MAG: DUF6057 family protein [Armatimonadota bacterium]|nr:DUF6057 family protein [Armatimonadota bacterium]
MRRVVRVQLRLGEGMGLRDLLFFTWLYVHLLFTVEPHLVFHARDPVFFLTPEFAREFFDFSGGATAYLSLFLAQLYARDGIGALLLTAETALIAGLTHLYFRTLFGRVVQAVRFVPAILFVMLCGRYDQPVTTGPATLFTLLCALGYALARPRGTVPRLLLYSVVTLIAYVGIGGASGGTGVVVTLLALALLCLLVELRHTRGFFPGLATVLLYLSIPAVFAFVGESYLFDGSKELWQWGFLPKPTWSSLLATAVPLSVPLTAAWVASGAPRVLAALAQHLAKLATSPRVSRKPNPPPPGREALPGLDPRVRWLLHTAVLLWVVLLGVRLSSDEPTRRLMRLDYFALNQRWDEVLEAAKEIPPQEATPLTSHDINLALFQKGLLADQMFHYPQYSRQMMLPFQVPSERGYLYRLTDLLLRLGRVNDAEHFGSEALAVLGPTPYILELLAKIHMVKGHPSAAQTFLNALSHDVVRGSWARRYLQAIRQDPELSGDTEIQTLRQVRLRKDDLAEVTIYLDEAYETSYPVKETMLQNLLRDNPRNRMALEYLMGLYLLDRRPDRVASNIYRLRSFGIERLPQAYEEAIAMYAVNTGRMPPLAGYSVSPNALERYRAFKRLLDQYGGDLGAALPPAQAEFGDTYFFYYTFGVGAGR